MPIEWNEDLKVGVEEIDEQHRELFRRVNDLAEAMWDGKGKEESGKVMDFLGDYVVTHFATEERHMSSQGYPDYAAHKRLHDRFVEDFYTLRSQFDSGEVTSSMVIRILDETCEWLKSHIKGTDKKLGSFLNR
ncbi:MAG: bacteriohemerythrin [Desulfomonilaceae bacterium]|nr:bacteriohemerythrin [Desulfomonilaceae bacterium]